VAKLKLNGVDIEAADGAPLVEVIKQAGVWISNLCYIDGLAPYAGCRTCLVSIEGMRTLQLSCTTRVTDGMVVETELPEVKRARQEILAIIDANHSDRCLTCHRRVKCMPGDICLRDDVVTHRCVTCSKNYRCELQTTNDLLDMGFENVEPWAGEPRTYYQFAVPDPDRANPFLEFDPQMCILCTRCVRACDELRHTGAITLAGRGFPARIAFGAGGPVHESNCDFCGACIDVCPTATLMEKPNKWIARSEDWTTTTCNSCSVGCTISIGSRAGRPVIVKPDPVNPVSADQICVRGRYHYDAIPARQRLQRHLVRRGPAGSPQFAAHWGELIEYVATQLKDIIARHGPASVAVLGSPFNTNEENYLAQKLARDVIGTPHIDFSAAAPDRAAAEAVAAAFGTEALPSDMLQLARSDVTFVIAADLESSHNIAALRIKDSVAGNPAAPRDGRLVLISTLSGEMADFAEPYGGVWLQPPPGGEPALVDALARRAAGEPAPLPDGADETAIDAAIALAKDASNVVSVVFAPSPADTIGAAEGAKAAANLAIALRGDNAAASLFVLPTEANVNGARDMGVDPRLGPGRAPAPAPGMSFAGMVEAANAGTLKAIIVVGDNPLMYAPGAPAVEQALASLDLLVVVDSVLTDTAKLAHAVFADVPAYAKTGTSTSGEHRVNRLHAAFDASGDARPALLALTDLAGALAANGAWTYAHPDAVTDEIAARVPGYEPYTASFNRWGKTRASGAVTKSERQPVSDVTVAAPAGSLVLITTRTLFTSADGAAIHAEDADKLHREEFAEVHPADAAALRISDGDPVTLAAGGARLTIRCQISGRVREGVVHVPAPYDGGAVMRLLGPDGRPNPVQLLVATPA